jgi:hypothetical protein
MARHMNLTTLKAFHPCKRCSSRLFTSVSDSSSEHIKLNFAACVDPVIMMSSLISAVP